MNLHVKFSMDKPLNIRCVRTFFVIIIFTGLMPISAFSQWAIGASYETRNADPEDGFGVRIERDFLQKLPIVEIALRAHFSFFTEDKIVQFVEGNQVFVSEQNITDYDFGLTAVGGVPIGLVKPYVGIGLGSNTVDVEFSDVENIGSATNEKDSKLFWNGLIGAEISVLPRLRPFVEYRFTELNEAPIDQDSFPAPSDSNERFIIGVMLRF